MNAVSAIVALGKMRSKPRYCHKNYKDSAGFSSHDITNNIECEFLKILLGSKCMAKRSNGLFFMDLTIHSIHLEFKILRLKKWISRIPRANTFFHNLDKYDVAEFNSLLASFCLTNLFCLLFILFSEEIVKAERNIL